MATMEFAVPAVGQRKGVIAAADARQLRREIDQFVGDDVDHIAFALDRADHAQNQASEHGASVTHL